MRELYETEVQDELAEDELTALAEIDPEDFFEEDVFVHATADYSDIEAGRL